MWVVGLVAANPKADDPLFASDACGTRHTQSRTAHDSRHNWEAARDVPAPD